jgi:hypothetical protein
MQERLVTSHAARRRGFALVFAIGVLAVLVMVVMAGANSAQFTYSFAHGRARDQQLGQAIRYAVDTIAARDWKAKPVPAQPETVEFAAPVPEAKDAVTARAVIAPQAPDEKTYRGLLAAREGDVLVRVEAETAVKSARRSALYLLNAGGKRPAPILLEEARK